MSLVQSLNNFALETLQRTNVDQSENTVFSPYSAFACVAMSLSLFKDETRNEILESLRIPSGQVGDIASFYPILKELLEKEISKYVSTSNRVWANERLPFSDSTFEVNKNILGVPIEKVGFPQPGCEKINEEVNRATHGMIPTIVNPGDVGVDTALVLVNAIYFKSDWEKKFDVLGNLPFTLMDGSQVQAEMISTKDRRVPYYEDDTYQVVAIPYKDNLYEFIIILPKDVQNGYNQLTSLTFEQQEALLNGMRRNKVNISLPKFKIETKSELTEIFKALGMNRAFTTAAQCADPNVPYMVSSIFQKAKIELDENGTVAAAATGMIMCCMCAPISPEINIDADHPFIYILRNAQTKAILFEGFLKDPR